jgi:hypothetical protein
MTTVSPGALVMVKKMGTILCGRRRRSRPPAPTYSPGTMSEHTMRIRRSTHLFASLRSPNRKILGKPNEDRARLRNM